MPKALMASTDGRNGQLIFCCKGRALFCFCVEATDGLVAWAMPNLAAD